MRFSSDHSQNEAATVTTMSSTASPVKKQSNTETCDANDVEEPSGSNSTTTLLPRTSSEKGERSSFVLLKKSTLLFFALLLFGFVVAFGYFFSEWMYQQETQNATNGKAKCILEDEVQCPYTEEDMENLSSEIDRLEGLNNDLSSQLDEYEDLTNRLNNSVADLKRQNDILSESNDRYEDLNDKLNDTVAELKDQNEFLAEQVDIFSRLNNDLNSSVIELTGQVDRLSDEVTNFTMENNRLEMLITSLSNETDTLGELSDNLQVNVDRLEGNIASLEKENSRLETSVENLRTIISFWDEVSENYEGTYEQMTSFLAQQISTNRFLLLETLQNTYHQRVADWDCALRDQFALEPFANDESVMIPENKFSEVMTYIDGRVLGDLCLDSLDFEAYLRDRYNSLAEITVARLSTSVQRYTWNAIDHYFPEEGEEGLTQEDWAVAEYNCAKLSATQKYSA